MATSTYNLIASQVVGSGGASSITFSSIPQTYTDLKLVISARSTSTSGAIGFQFNGDTGSNYSWRRIIGNGSSASSGSGTAVTGVAGDETGTDLTASTFSNNEMYIPNYSVSGIAKSVSVDGVTENNATTAYAQLTANLWTGTGAITQITILSYGGSSANLAQNSTFYLYGIKNS